MRLPSGLVGLAGTMALVLTGCAASPRTSSPATSTQIVLGTPSPPPAPEPTVEPPSVVEPSTGTPTVEPTFDPPPIARLAVGGHVYPGRIGGYTWKTYAESAPWLPATALDPVAVAPESRLSVKLVGTPGASWTARVARAVDTNGEHVTGLGEGRGVIVLKAPRTGSWVLSVSIEYAEGLGGGAYYWRLVVR